MDAKQNLFGVESDGRGGNISREDAFLGIVGA
jgi:hypothetical protein